MRVQQPQRILLEAEVSGENILLMGEQITLADADAVETWETLTRVVKFNDDYYGEVNITRQVLLALVDNFAANVYGQELSIDLSHDFSGGSGGFIRELKLEGDRLRARIGWTEYGREAVTKKGFRYFSADFHPNYKHPETGEKHGPVLFGAALTTRPRVKNLDAVDPGPLKLSADVGDRHVALAPHLHTQLSSEIETMWKELLEQLKAKAAELKLSENVVNSLLLSLQAALKPITDEATAKLMLDSHINLAESTASEVIRLSGDPSGGQPPAATAQPGGLELSEDQLQQMIAKQLQQQQEAARQAEIKLAEDTSAQKKKFTDAINAYEGFKELPKAQVEQILQLGETITAMHSDAAVQGLVDSAIKLGDSFVAQQKLQGLGYGQPQGRVQMTETDADLVTKLQGQIDEHLKRSRQHHDGTLTLTEPAEGSFGHQMLEEFDRQNIRRLQQESIQLASGEVAISDTDLPVSFQRTVIRESMADENVMALIDASTDPGATQVTQIPYEVVDESQITNNGVVYEGQPIPPGGVQQLMDMAYLFPMKLSMNVSNEVVHFSRASQINWDAWARNIQSNGEVMRKLTARLVANEMQRAADSYAAADISGEGFDAQLTGSNSIIKTVQFPIVRPHQVRDITGAAIGSETNPITLVLNGVTLSEYDGSGSQAAGTYYRVTNYNLGYIQLVDETGTPVTPTDTGTNTLDYSYATNIVKFDLDIPANTKKEDHYDGLLAAIGSQKAMMEADRYRTPNFGLSRPILLDIISNATSFTDSGRRDGSSTDNQGGTAVVKGIPTGKTNALIDFGDERLMLGERGTLKFRVAKVWQMEPVTEAIDPTTGRPTGKKIAYGEQIVGMKVPQPIRDRLTSVIAYSFTNR